MTAGTGPSRIKAALEDLSDTLHANPQAAQVTLAPVVASIDNNIEPGGFVLGDGSAVVYLTGGAVKG